MKDIPVEEQRLLFAGEEPKDKRTLSSLKDFQRDSTISLIHRGAIIQISVRFVAKTKTQKGFFTNLNVGVFDTIEQIKMRVIMMGIPSSQQMLMLEGKQLKDNKTISYYNIKDNSQLQLLLKTSRNKSSSGKRWLRWCRVEVQGK